MTLRPNPLTVAIRGSKGGQGSQHTPTEAPDTLHDVARIRIVDLLAEGELAGFVHGATNPLRDVYLNETPVCNDDDSFNFADVKIDSRSGTQDQDAMPGYGGTENEIGVNVELNSSAPWSQALSNLDLSAVRIRIGVDALQKSDASTGDINGHTIQYAIDVSTDGGAYVSAGSFKFSGKASDAYERTHRVDLPPATTGWTVRVTRTTANANSATIADTTRILSYTEIIDAVMRYPNSAHVGITVDAKQFQSVPSRCYNMLGRIMSVPSNYDPKTRVYTGTWDGTFKPAWTNNPAWVFYDLVLNSRFGLGKYITPARVNKWALYTIAQYCDGLVPDGKGGQEPRFTCTLYLQTQAEAYKVLADLVSVFRGITYWSGSQVQAIADMPGDADFEYNAANVIGGKFEYAGTGRKTRYTVALVSWNDPADFGRAKVAYVPDRDGIARYGIQPTQLIAVGATTKTQAKRAGLWALLTSRLDDETVTWGVGQDGVLVAPGRICRIADPKRAGKRQGGRLASVGTRTNDLPYSNDLTQWTPSGGPTGAGVAAPDGSGPMTRLTAAAAGVVKITEDLGTDRVGTQITFAVVARRDQNRYAKLYGFGNGGNGVTFDLQAGTAQVNDSWVSATCEVIDANYALIYGVLTPLSSNTAVIGLASDMAGNGNFAGGEYLDFWGARSNPGTTPDALVVTGATPETVTDITVDKAPDVAAAGDSLNVMLPSGVSESKPINAIDGKTVTVTGTFSETPVAEAVWTVDAASLKTQTVRVLTVREQFDDGKVQYVLTGVKHNASKFDAVDFGAPIEDPPTVAYPGNVQAAPTVVSLSSYPVQYASTAGMTLSIGWDKPANAVHYWVQYRRSNGQWSPRRLTSTRHMDIPNVMPGTYEASVVAVSPLGIESTAMVSDPLVVNDPNKVPGIVDDIKAEADAAKADASAANAELADIASDNVLTAGEKPTVIRDYNVITTEQAGIDAQADAYGITTEKTAYDGKVTALTTYLGTLTSPEAWNDISGNTTIVGADFRQAFADVYTSRQALLNAIYAAAKARADAAQEAADNAAPAGIVNPGFDKGLWGWTPENDASNWYAENSTTGPNSGTTTYLVHRCTGATSYVRNKAVVPVVPGQVIKATCSVKGVSTPNGTPSIRLLFLDASKGDIASPASPVKSGVTGNARQTLTVQGSAPSNAAYVLVSLGSGGTTGYHNFDDVAWTYQPASIDEIPDGLSFTRAIPFSSAVSIGNANFEAAVTSDGTIPGWVPYNGGTIEKFLTTLAPIGPTNCLHAYASGSTPQGFGGQSIAYKCSGGDHVWIRCWAYSESGNPAAATVLFFNSAGSNIGSFYAANLAYGSWGQVSNGGVAPEGTVSFVIRLGNSNTAGGSSYFDDIEVRTNDVRVSGSGARLGDLRNQVMVGVGNFASAWSGGSITYSATSTSATITAGAATLVAGDFSKAYNQASTTVSGSAGATTKYYLYYDDGDYTGGSRALHATTSVITSLNANGRLKVGEVTVTFPTSGSSSGGGNTGCPDENAWVLRSDPNGIRPDWLVRAKEVRVGHFLRLTDGTAGLVTFSERKAARRVRVVAEGSGKSLTCSTTAPLELAECRDGAYTGACVQAPEAAGRVVRILCEKPCVAALIERVEAVGPGYVQHITCQNACFWTGDDPDYLFGHHNMKPIS